MNAKKLSRRGVYAFIALAEVPMPRGVNFPQEQDGKLQIQVESWPELLAWAKLLEISGEPFIGEYETGNTSTILSGTWGGWGVILSLFLPVVEAIEHVDAKTRARLEAAIADEASGSGDPT